MALPFTQDGVKHEHGVKHALPFTQDGVKHGTAFYGVKHDTAFYSGRGEAWHCLLLRTG